MKHRLPNRKLLGVLALGAFLVGLDSQLVVTLVPAMTASVHVPADNGGLLVTVYALAYAVSAPIFGPISDRRGRKLVLLIGLAVLGMSTALTSEGHTFGELLAFRAAAGCGGGMVMPTLFALVGDTIPAAQRGQAMGLVMGALLSASVIGIPLGSFLAYGTTWPTPFWVVGLLAGLTIAMAGTVIPPRLAPISTPPSLGSLYRRQLRTAFTQRPVFFSLLSSFLWMGSLYGMFAYVGVYYTQNFDLNVASIGLIIMLGGFANMMGNIVGGRLSDAIGGRRVMVWASLVATLCVVTFSIVTHHLVAAIVAQAIWNIALGSGTATLTAIVSELSPAIRGAILSLNSSAMYFGAALATATSAALLIGGGFFRVGVVCGMASMVVGPMVYYLVSTRWGGVVQ